MVPHTVNTKLQKHMRTTKAVLCAAALAAGALTSMAQVYSANVVGYVNVTVAGGGAFTIIANPLNNTGSGGNSITNLFAGAGDGDTILRWDVNAFDFQPTVPTYNGFSHTWSDAFNLNAGEGVFYNNNNADRTITFVGEVIQTAVTRTLTGGGAFNCIGSTAPLGNGFTNSVAGFTPGDGDTILTWSVAAFDFDPTVPTYNGFSHTWSDTGVTIAPGIGFFYNNNNSDVSWTRNFTVQ